MKNKNELKHTPIQLESLRSELIEKTFSTNSNFLRLSLYQNYFEKILSLNNPNFEEAFLKEFLDDYLACIGKFEVWGIEPGITKKLLEQIKKISILKIISESLTSLNYEVDRIEKQIEKLTLILDGKDFEDGETHKAFFPLIDKEAPDGFYGIIESVTVRINKTVNNDKFILVPSEKEIEMKIIEQCKKSWLLALDLLKNYVKRPYKYHEVIISFDKKDGFYEGNSLGIALALSFLEQLLKFYNPAYVIKIKEQSAFTGGVLETGKVLCTSEEIIKRKVAAVFFSEINTFVFHKCEETYAYFALTQLKEIYPDRKLKLIPVEDINDVLNRRDVVDIKKQKLIVRSGKFIKKNWISGVATVLLAILFAYLFVMDFDDNPAIAIINGNQVFIQNKNGKQLWKTDLQYDYQSLSKTNFLRKFIRIIDTNNDGINEVLVANEQKEKESGFNSVYFLRCYSKYKDIIWEYTFTDKVESNRGILEPTYSFFILDTIEINKRKSLYIIASNSSSFSSAILNINLITGKQNTGVLWCSGHTVDGVVKDINGDRKKDIFCIGVDNGFEDIILFGFTPGSKNVVRPSTYDYQIKNYPTADFINLIRIPKTDYDFALQNRFQAVNQASLMYISNEQAYFFILDSDPSNLSAGIWYKLKPNLLDFNISIDDQFRVKRDSLVANGILNPPYSDTKEYENIIKEKILYWKNGQWVKRYELNNKKLP